MGGESGRRRAEELFSEFLRRRESGEDLSIDRFCAEHPEHEEELRELFSLLVARLRPELSTVDVDPVGESGAHPEEAVTEKLFKEFLRRRESGEDLSIDEFCAEHAENEDPLRGLYSLYITPVSSQLSTADVDPIGGLNAHPAEAVTADDSNLPSPGIGGAGEASEDEQIGPYRIVKPLGSGTFGVVYLAEQEHPIQRCVAIKVLKRGMNTDDLLKRFEAERQALARMDHDAIVKVHDAGTTDNGQAFFVMDFFDSKPLGKYLEKNRLPLRSRLELFARICDGVHHAHTRVAVLHRDLKPANILVGQGDEGEPRVRIIDFGLAKALGEPLIKGGDKTLDGTIVGTPLYMSPEQAVGDEVDFRTDVYSLGVILFEILTGAPIILPDQMRPRGSTSRVLAPHEIDPPTPRSRLAAIARGDFPTTAIVGSAVEARELRRKLRPDMDWIVRTALEKDRTRRYGAVADLRDDVKQYLARGMVRARPPSWGYRIQKFLTKHRIAATFALVVVLLLAGAVVVNVYLTRKALLERVRQSLDTGRSQWTSYQDLAKQTRDRERRHSALARGVPSWHPVWERSREIDNWTVLQKLRPNMEKAFIAATQKLREGLAVEIDAPDIKAGIRSLISEMGRARYQEAVRTGGVLLQPEFFRALYEEGSTGGGNGPDRYPVTIETDPPGVAVHCFLYVRDDEETRLIPRPFNPRVLDETSGTIEECTGETALVVAPGWPAPAPFRPSDRFRAVGDQPVRRLTELAAAVRHLSTDQAVDVVVRRDEGEATLSWIPFPQSRIDSFREYGVELKPGRLVQAFLQFGLRFEIYPLDLNEENLLGATSSGGLTVALPEGSFVLVFTKDGFEDARYPILFSKGGGSRTVNVKLVRKEDRPPGFVYVPSGEVATGGDSGAFNPVRPDLYSVSGFFIGRYEVTVKEWLEFVNAPEILARIDPEGFMKPRVPETRQWLLEVSEDGGDESDTNEEDENRIQVVPEVGLDFEQDQSGRWSPNEESVYVEGPALGISHFAALEYLHWRTEVARREGKPWRYRLPTNLEWERAARGVDRRIYPWGNYNVWSFSWSPEGNFLRWSERVAICPFDESPFGVRDMAGSALEHTAEELQGFRSRYYRGGSWDQLDDLYFRIASRNSMLPDIGERDNGFRVVIEVIREDGASTDS